jgi:NADPH2:quinone reductase
MGWPNAMCSGPTRLSSSTASPSSTIAGQAVTLRFVPQRPDIAADKPTGGDSPEYKAFSQCAQGRVLVASSVAPVSNSIGGDIKFLALKQREVEGLVTDGSVRDMATLGDYGFPVFAAGKTARQGPAYMQPWAVNDVVEVGGVAVRPGDIVVADDDGVVIVPLSVHEEVLEIAQEREAVEDVIKETIEMQDRCPSEYYPFKPPISRKSPLGQLLAKRLPHSKMLARQYSASTVSSTSSIPTSMHAVIVPETGPASVMKVRRDVNVPSSLSSGQCLVRNEYSGLNFIDTYHRGGLYPRELPFIVGQEAGGAVVATTPEAELAGLRVGDRVAYSSLGTYAEYSAVDSSKLLPVPEGLGLPEATACVVQGLTAHYLTTDAHAGLIQPGQWMLVHAAAGGTGQFAVQMARAQGFKVIGTCSTGKLAIAKNIGCDAVVDYNSENVAERVMEITDGVGVHCALDGVGKSTAESSLDSLAVRGVCVFFGNASGPVEPVSPLRLIGKSSFVTRPKLLDYTRTPEELRRRAKDTFGWVADGSVRVSIDRTYPLSEAIDAHEYIEAGNTIGKVLLDCR